MTTPSSITQPLIEVRGLTCERGERTLFTGMSFTVAPGSLVRIAGSNGAGKTTLLRLLTGLMRPAEGEIFWRGEPILKAAQDFWRELCYIGHRNGVKDDLSVMENVLINARIASLSCTPEAAPWASQTTKTFLPASSRRDSADALRWRVFGFQNLCRFGSWMNPLQRSMSRVSPGWRTWFPNMLPRAAWSCW